MLGAFLVHKKEGNAQTKGDVQTRAEKRLATMMPPFMRVFRDMTCRIIKAKEKDVRDTVRTSFIKISFIFVR